MLQNYYSEFKFLYQHYIMPLLMPHLQNWGATLENSNAAA